MFQNKDKNLITNNYLFVMKVLKKYYRFNTFKRN